jgi:hypothetical protein
MMLEITISSSPSYRHGDGGIRHGTMLHHCTTALSPRSGGKQTVPSYDLRTLKRFVLCLRVIDETEDEAEAGMGVRCDGTCCHLAGDEMDPLLLHQQPIAY